MGSSEVIARSFYNRLGAARLASRTTPDWDQQIVSRVKAMLCPGHTVLDVGCGYGRISIPLALAGFEVVGLDISDALLTAARRNAENHEGVVTWIHANMCRLPLRDEAVDVALCLWSAFYELLLHEEQLSAVRQIYRVLRPHGWALFEGPIYAEATEEEIRTGTRYGPGHRVSGDVIEGLENHHFRQVLQPSSIS